MSEMSEDYMSGYSLCRSLNYTRQLSQPFRCCQIWVTGDKGECRKEAEGQGLSYEE